MRKINETTFEEDAIVDEIPQRMITVQNTLDGVIADIAGIENWITSLENDLVKAQEALVRFKDKRDAVIALGIKTQAELEVQRELEEQLVEKELVEE